MTYNFSARKLAELVRAYRDREGLSLRELAERTKLSHATLSRIENHKEAKAAPDTYTVIQLVNACGFSLEDIFQSNDAAGTSTLQEISTQLRASKEISIDTMQALEAVIRAVRLQLSSEQTN